MTQTTSTKDLDEQIERLKRCEYLKESEVKALCLRAREILVEIKHETKKNYFTH